MQGAIQVLGFTFIRFTWNFVQQYYFYRLVATFNEFLLQVSLFIFTGYGMIMNEFVKLTMLSCHLASIRQKFRGGRLPPNPDMRRPWTQQK